MVTVRLGQSDASRDPPRHTVTFKWTPIHQTKKAVSQFTSLRVSPPVRQGERI